jgi:hypothetical protein
MNIDPVYFLTPVTVMAISFGPVVYLNRKGRLSIRVMLYAFVAYFSAIALKIVFQNFTLGFVKLDGTAMLGIYYGLQTSLFEVGLAYIVARQARGSINSGDGLGYGLSLAMWENGVLISIPLLLDYALYYAMLPGSPQLYSLLHAEAPSLFFPLSAALPLIGFAVIERVSSLLLHLSWGYLTVMAVFTRRRGYVASGMVMGFADFLVPFEQSLGLATFEAIMFAIAAASAAFTFLVISRQAQRS